MKNDKTESSASEDRESLSSRGQSPFLACFEAILFLFGQLANLSILRRIYSPLEHYLLLKMI